MPPRPYPYSALSLVRPPGRLPSCVSGPLRRALSGVRLQPARPASPISQRLARRHDLPSPHRLAFLLAGALAGITGTVLMSIELYRRVVNGPEGETVPNREGGQSRQARQARQVRQPSGGADRTVIQMDGPDGLTPGEDGIRRKIIVHDHLGREVVPTGNSTVPTFPRTIELSSPIARTPTSADTVTTMPQDPSTEYTLVGLGVRTVTIFGIRVYLLGLYVATADIARLQAHLVRRVNPIATTLIPSERDSLRAILLDPVAGEAEWDALLREAACRTLIRIVPVRDTSIGHMRDALVNAATGRASQRGITDRSYGQAVGELRSLFGIKGTASTGQELLLCRDSHGQLLVLRGDDKGKKRSELGRVADERLSRLLWLHYLAGKKVASEQARGNIIEGIMEFVERPVGTVATQVI